MTEAQLSSLEILEDPAPLTQPEAEPIPPLPENAARAPEARAGSVGPWLFAVTLIAVMGLFWWLTLYTHGVAPHAS